MKCNLRSRIAGSTLTVSLVLMTGSAFAGQTVRLFDSVTFAGWTTLEGQPISEGWEIVDGMIHRKAGPARAGQLITEQEYGDIDLQFEWRIAPKGNSGVKYRVRPFGGKVLGCEYQILDDQAYADKLPPSGMTGSLYDVYEPNECRFLRPAGEFNYGRIVVWGDHIEHWLNGRLIVSATVGGAEWFRRIADSKFARVEGFGQNRCGKIMLTDHGSEVWYRNIVLRPLPPPETVCCPQWTARCTGRTAHLPCLLHRSGRWRRRSTGF